jgi:magnesium-protoporphyrin O-methyltransferase
MDNATMDSASYSHRRGEIETYFDRTAAAAWARLTSDAPLGRIRSSVRAGRDRMRSTLLSWLPQDLHGLRVLDAGCGTGALAIEAARRGAEVVAIDLSPTLVNLARERLPSDIKSTGGAGSVVFHSGDMLSPTLGHFDHVVAMDSIIHYSAADAVGALSALAERTRGSMVFTFAPRTPLLATMIAVGRLFPRTDRAPWLSPMAADELNRLMQADLRLRHWRAGRTQRISSGFYTSQALEWQRPTQQWRQL